MTIPGNRILIQPTEPINQLPSGLFLPDTAVQKSNTGTIVIVGTKADPLLQGKKIMYNPAMAIDIGDKHLLHVLEIKFILA